jgi:anti-sigma-K factor RskA
MTCNEFKEQVDAWVLGALEEGEAQECEEHLTASTGHEGCPETLTRARATAAALTGTLPAHKPDPQVWMSIEQALDPEPIMPARSPVRPWRERLAWAIAAASLLFAGGLGWKLHGVTATVAADASAAIRLKAAYQAALSASRSREMKLQSDKDACGKELAGLKGDAELQHDALALLEDPRTQVVTFQPGIVGESGAGSRATALVNLVTGRALVLSSTLQPKPGSDFELWVLRGKEPPRPAGFLRPRGDGTVAGEIDRRLLADGTPDALAVSVEPAGGRPTPTAVILIGALKS